MGEMAGRLPDFIVIGAMKCATSTVCAYLEDHPNAYIMPRTEPEFFSIDENWRKGTDWYGRFFAGADGERIVGEGSNSYTNRARFPAAADRMREVCPNVRLVYLVRHPLRRVLSDWIQRRAQDRDSCPASPDSAVRAAPDVFVDPSRYWRQLEAYRALFPDEQIFVGCVEDLSRDPEAFFGRLCGFLGIAPAPRVERPHANPSDGKRVPSRLYDVVKAIPGVRGLRRLLPDALAGRLVERHLLTDVGEQARFSPETAAWLAEELRDDSARLLVHIGRPADFWNLDEV